MMRNDPPLERPFNCSFVEPLTLRAELPGETLKPAMS